jgi:hypothetical protein
LEVLEHLPCEDLLKGILELQKVSRKYILVTVPNGEGLERSLVRCPECYCWFNPGLHMRSFNKEKLQYIFKDFKLIVFEEMGPKSQKEAFLSYLPILFYRWKKPLPPENSVCPQCGYFYKRDQSKKVHEQLHRLNLKKVLILLVRFLGIIIGHPEGKSYWLLALYERK